MPPVPGTSSTTFSSGPQPPMIFAARPAALGVAPQGTQYSMRTV